MSNEDFLSNQIPINQPILLSKLYNLVGGIELESSLIPNIQVVINEILFDKRSKRYRLSAFFKYQNDRVELLLHFNIETNEFIELRLSSTSSSPVPIIALLPNVLLEHGKDELSEFRKNISSSTITFLKLYINNEGFSFYAQGSFIGINGEIALALNTKVITSPKLSFHFSDTGNSSPISIPDILTSVLGLDISDSGVSFLPQMAFAVNQLSLDQHEGEFLLEGIATQANFATNENAYYLEGSLNVKWNNGVEIDLSLNADDKPITLSALENDLPFSLEIIRAALPPKTVDKLVTSAFHSLDINLNTGERSLSMSGVINLFDSLFAKGSFNYTTHEGISFEVTVLSPPLSLKEILEVLGLEVSSTDLPKLKISIQEISFIQSRLQFSIRGVIEGDSGQATLDLLIQILPKGEISIDFNYHSEDSARLTVEDIVSNSLPSSFLELFPSKQSKNKLLQNLNNSSLHDLKMNINTAEKELNFYASGEVMEMKGEIALSVIIFLKKPTVSFHIFNDAANNLKSISSILIDTLGIDIPNGVESWLPKTEFALSELSFDQLESHFVLKGMAAQSCYAKSQEGYLLESSLTISWHEGLQVELGLDARKNPILLSALEQDLPFSLDEIKSILPQKTVEKFGATAFHNLSINLDTNEQSVEMEGTSSLFGKISVTGKFNYIKDKGLQFSTHCIGEAVSLIDVIDLLEIPLDKTMLPKMALALKTISFDQQTKSFELISSLEQNEVQLGVFINISWKDGLKLEIRLEGEPVPLTFYTLAQNLPVPQVEINQLLPTRFLQEVGFHRVSLELDTLTKELDLNGKMAILGSLATSNARIFKKDNATCFFLTTTIDSIAFKTLIEKVGIPPLPDNFPSLTFKELHLSVDTSTKTIAFKGQSALDTQYKIGNTSVILRLGVDSTFSPTSAQKLTGTFQGGLTFVGNDFAAKLVLSQESQLTFQQQNEEKGIALKHIIKELAGQTITLPPEIPEFTISGLNAAINTTTREFSFSGQGTIDWDLFKNGKPLKAIVVTSFDRIQQSPAEYKYQGMLNINSQGNQLLTPEIKISNYAFAVKLNNNSWGIAGEIDATIFDKTFHLQAGIVSVNNQRTITFKTDASATQSLVKFDQFELENIDFDLAVDQNQETNKSNVSGSISAEIMLANIKAKLSASIEDTLTFKATIPDLQLLKLSQHLLGVELPQELPDVRFQNLNFTFTPAQKAFSLEGEVTTGDYQLNAGTSSLSLSKITLIANRDALGTTKFDIAISGSGKVTDDLVFNNFNFTFGYDQGWKLIGSLQSTIFDQAFDLSASYVQEILTLSYEKTTKKPLLQIPDIGSINISTVALSLQRQEKTLNWEFSSKGSLVVQDFVGVNGTLSFKQSVQNTTFSFIPEKAEIVIPVFSLQDSSPLSLHFNFGDFIIDRKTIDNKSQWGFEASVSFSCPKFYEILPPEIKSVFPPEITTKFIARGKSIQIITDKILDVRVDIPPIQLAEGTTVPVGLTRFSLTNLAINIGKEISLSVDLGLGLPASLNKNFGVKDDGHPFLNLFNTFDETNPEETTLRTRLVAGTKGVKIMLVTSPFGFIEFEEAEGKIWCIADLGECGAVRFQIPEFSLDLKTRSFIFNGGFEVVKGRELAIPLHLVKLLMKGAKADDLVELLPDKLPLQEISLLDDNDKLDTDEFVAIFEKILKVNVPDEFKTVLGVLEEGTNRLPDGFRKYLKISIPKSFNFDISITPENQGVSVKVGVKKGDPPIRLLLPTSGPMGIPQFVGVELYNFTLGELYGTNFFLLEMDVRIDHFDLVNLAGAVALGTDHGLPIPSSNDIQRRLIIEDLFTLIFAGIKVYGVPIPIPIPLFYTELGFEYCGLEGIRTEGHISFQKPELNIVGLLKSMTDLVKFVSQPQARMNPLALGKMDVRFGIGSTYFQIPDYMGGSHIGTKTGIPLPGAYELMAKMLNAIKFFSLSETISSIPIEHRLQFETIKFFDLEMQANWLITTLSEFRATPSGIAAKIAAKGDELTSLLPSSNENIKNKDGVVVFLQGGFNIKEIAHFESAFALVSIDGQSFATGFYIDGVLADLFSLSVKGRISIDNTKVPILDAAGKVNLKFLNKQVLDGNVALNDQGLSINGNLDLFPGTGPLKVTADIKGHIKKDSFGLHGNAAVVAGNHFNLANAHININEKEFLIKGSFLNQSVILSLQQKETALRFFAAMTPIHIGDVFAISGNSPSGGPVLYLELGNIYEKPKVEILPIRDMTGGASETVQSPVAPSSNQSDSLMGINNYEDWTPSGDGFCIYLSAKATLFGISCGTDIFLSDQGFSCKLEGKLFDLFQCNMTLSGSNLEGLASLNAEVHLLQMDELEAGIRNIFNQKLTEATNTIAAGEAALERAKNEATNALNNEISRLNGEAENRKRELTAGIANAENWLNERKREVAAIEAKIKGVKDDFDRNTIGFINDRFRDAKAILDLQQGVVNTIQNEINGQHNWYNHLNGAGKFWNGAGHVAKIGILEAAKGVAWTDLQVKKAIVDGIQNEINNAYNNLKNLTDGLIGEKGIAQTSLNEATNKLNEAKSALNSLPSWMFSPEQLALEAAKHVSSVAVDLAKGELSKTKHLFQGVQKLSSLIPTLRSPINFEEAHFTTNLEVMKSMTCQVNLKVSFLSPTNEWHAKNMNLTIDFNNLPKTAGELVTNLLAI